MNFGVKFCTIGMGVLLTWFDLLSLNVTIMMPPCLLFQDSDNVDNDDDATPRQRTAVERCSASQEQVQFRSVLFNPIARSCQ